MGKGQGVLIACCPRISIHRHRGGIAIAHRNGDIRPRIGRQLQGIGFRHIRWLAQLGEGQRGRGHRNTRGGGSGHRHRHSRYGCRGGVIGGVSRGRSNRMTDGRGAGPLAGNRYRLGGVPITSGEGQNALIAAHSRIGIHLGHGRVARGR